MYTEREREREEEREACVCERQFAYVDGEILGACYLNF